MSGMSEEIPIASVVVGEGRRAPRNVAELADSIREVGLLNPITVTTDRRLVSGGHRLAACESLGWETIPATIVDLDALHAELAEIDENLVRNELTALERSEQLLRRKKIYLALHPETGRGKTPAATGSARGGKRPREASKGKVRGGKNADSAFLPPEGPPPGPADEEGGGDEGDNNGEVTPSFVEDTAKKSGQAGRTVEEDIQIANGLPEALRDRIRGTPLADRKTELLKIARLGGAAQAAIVELILATPGLSVAQAQRQVARERKQAELEAKAAETVESDLPTWEIVEGDCLEAFAKIESGSVRLVFADPPYNQGIIYGDHCNDNRPELEYLRWCADWIRECHRVLAPDGSLWVLISHEYAALLELIIRGNYRIEFKAEEGTDAALLEGMVEQALGGSAFSALTGRSRFHVRSWITWFESFGVNTADNFNRCSRRLLRCTKLPKQGILNRDAVTRPSDRQEKYGDGRADPGGKLWDDVWGINPPIPRLVGNAAERLPDFPTQLPLALLRPIVGCCTDPGDLVLDPFSGSGTTGAACIELGRRYLGIEQSPDFAAAARSRLATTTPTEVTHATR